MLAQVYYPIFMLKTSCFHPVSYLGRHDCFPVRKQPSSFLLFSGVKRASEAQDQHDITEVIASKCCARQCTTFFTPEQVASLREEYWGLKQADQRRFLQKAIRDARDHYSLHGQHACEAAFLLLLKVGRRR